MDPITLLAMFIILGIFLLSLLALGLLVVMGTILLVDYIKRWRARRVLATLVLLTLAGARSRAQQQTPHDLLNQIKALQQQQDVLINALDAALPPDPPPPPPCTYTVTPTSPPPVTASGGTVPVAVTAGVGCAWAVAAPDSWAQIDVQGGTGDGTATISVQANGTAAPRSSGLTVAGSAVTVQQDALPKVTTAADLTKALAAKQPVIYLAQGTISGNFTVLASTLIVGTDQLTGRVSPADVAAWQVVAADPLRPVFSVPPKTPATTDVTLRGFTITGVGSDRTALVIGNNATTDVAQQPVRVTIDQMAILGTNGRGHRGVEAHGADVRITRNYIAGWLEQQRQSQGVYGANGPGPYLIEDNYIEASGENILFGGDDPRIQNLVPSDITVRANLIFKPQAWRQAPGSVANLLELKCAQRVLIEGNTLDGNWKDIQAGHPNVFTARNQNGKAPWCLVDAVTYQHNVVRNTSEPGSFAVNILGNDDLHPSAQTQTITIDHNLFEDSPRGVQINRGVLTQFTFTRNTAPKIKGSVLYFIGLTGGVPTGGYTPTIFEKNVFTAGAYGVYGEGAVAPGTSALAWWSNGRYTLTGNVIEKGDPRVTWPTGNSLLAAGMLAGLLDTAFHYTPDASVGW